MIALNKIRALGNYHKAAKRDMRRNVASEAIASDLGAFRGRTKSR